jgi:hypothetical protein
MINLRNKDQLLPIIVHIQRYKQCKIFIKLNKEFQKTKVK